MVRQAYDGHLVGHVSRDATATEGREKAKPGAAGRRRQRDGSLPDRQGRQSLEAMLAALPYNCDVGRKKGSKGHCMTWCGDKLHLDVADGGVPLSCILTSASRHDSQVAVLTGERVAHLYALMDSAYDAKAIKAYCEASGQVAIIRTNPRRNKRLKEVLAREATAQRHASQIDPASLRYRLRSTAERCQWPSEGRIRWPQRLCPRPCQGLRPPDVRQCGTDRRPVGSSAAPMPGRGPPVRGPPVMIRDRRIEARPELETTATNQDNLH